jgi:protein-disulfide isomerase
MTHLNRRDLLQTAAAFGALAITAVPALAVDVAELNKPPAIGDMSMGNPNAKVTMVEYASASCPHCAAFYKDVFPALKAEYIDTNKINFIFREFPHNDAALAAFMIARSAPKEAYFPLVDIYFKTQATWLAGNWVDGLFDIAKQAGFNREKFDATLKDEALAKSILAVRDQAEKFGVTGIPTFFINGEMLDGEQKIETLRAKIDPLLG